MAEFTGERVIPGEVDPNLLNEHRARYIFAARLAPGRRVLDAGCGAGYGAAELGQYAAEVLGVDISPEAIRYAKDHYQAPNLRFEHAPCTALPVPDGSVDVVTAFEVIEHLSDWRDFLSEVRRVLAPDGEFLVSTPNKLYYAESRQRAGPNPFHVHEFAFAEFQDELAAIFPHVTMFLENHAEGILFQPVGQPDGWTVIGENACSSPGDSHFFLAVCGLRPHAALPGLVYVPRMANVLRERERHINLLESELATKSAWLEKATAELAALHQQHQTLLEMLEQRNRWAESLNRQLEDCGAEIERLQAEWVREQASFREAVASYEAKVAELEQENRDKTRWALETEHRLSSELQQKVQELGDCVEYLQRAEQTVEERTHWAQSAQAEAERLSRQLSMVQASRWIRLGRKLGVGPRLTT